MKLTAFWLIVLVAKSAFGFLNCDITGSGKTFGFEFDVLNQNIQYFFMKHLNPVGFAWFNHTHGRCLQSSVSFHDSRFVIDIMCLAQPFTAIGNVSVIEWQPANINMICRLGGLEGNLFEQFEIYLHDKKTNRFGLMAINQPPTFTEILPNDTSRVRFVNNCSCNYRIIMEIDYKQNRTIAIKANQSNNFLYGIIFACIFTLLVLLICGIALILYCTS
uniref:Uncharacterized protein n=1 Tax=Anopheles culicifacies TaxID=139723 RepID=A0A182MF38_9DIPT